MSRVFDDNAECMELFLHKPDIKVDEVHTHRKIKKLLELSVRNEKMGKLSDEDITKIADFTVEEITALTE